MSFDYYYSYFTVKIICFFFNAILFGINLLRFDYGRHERKQSIFVERNFNVTHLSISFAIT